MATMQLPALPLRGLVILPTMTLPVDVARKKAITAIEKGIDNGLFFAVMQKDGGENDPAQTDLERVGTIVQVRQMLKLNNVVRLYVEGVERAELLRFEAEEGYTALIQTKKPRARAAGITPLMRTVLREYERYLQLSGNQEKEEESWRAVDDASRLCDLIASACLADAPRRQDYLNITSATQRLNFLLEFLLAENDIKRAERRISARVKKKIEASQKEYYLREQIKAIHEELGDRDAQETDGLAETIEQSDMPPEVKEKARKELERSRRMAPGMPESSLIRNYIDWLLELPWKKQTEDNLDITNAETILNNDHFALEKVKERILEFLAVKAMARSMKGSILCLVGPPGVGKTSVARSVARALGRKFVRISLGGLHDEAEIRGHRRTYVGALPGRIITSMKQAQTINPVMLLDEVDKMTSDFRGDPASAMLEVLDSEQNNTFRDYFLEVPYDLSRVLFIATANTTDTIPRALFDRMEIIELSSYTEYEKLEIARRHLLKKQITEHGLPANALEITRGGLERIINFYTREAGVRELERRLAALCRKAAIRLLKGENKIKVNEKNLSLFLGRERYPQEEDKTIPGLVGTATGLAWTVFGGQTLSIDVEIMPGAGELQLTGQLGDVMKESARAAYSILRAHGELWGIDAGIFKTRDIHVHIPAGAMPKDGPSAGVTLFCAMLSAFTGAPVPNDLAMTGEITIKGRVLPIGGLKEKSIAAYKAGKKRVLLPKANLPDLDDVPELVRKKVKFIPVESIFELLPEVFGRPFPTVTKAPVPPWVGLENRHSTSNANV